VGSPPAGSCAEEENGAAAAGGARSGARQSGIDPAAALQGVGTRLTKPGCATITAAGMREPHATQVDVYEGEPSMQSGRKQKHARE